MNKIIEDILKSTYSIDFSEEFLRSNWEYIKNSNYILDVLNSQIVPRDLWEDLSISKISIVNSIINNQYLNNPVKDIINIINEHKNLNNNLLNLPFINISTIFVRDNYINNLATVDDIVDLYKKLFNVIKYKGGFTKLTPFIFNNNLTTDWITNNLDTFLSTTPPSSNRSKLKDDFLTKLFLLKFWDNPEKCNKDFLKDLNKRIKDLDLIESEKILGINCFDDFWWEGWKTDEKQKLFIINNALKYLGFKEYYKNKYYLGENLNNAWIPIYIVTDTKKRPLGVSCKNIYRLKVGSEILNNNFNYIVSKRKLESFQHFEDYLLMGEEEKIKTSSLKLNLLLCKCKLKDIYWDSIRKVSSKLILTKKVEILGILNNFQEYSVYKNLLPLINT